MAPDAALVVIAAAHIALRLKIFRNAEIKDNKWKSVKLGIP
jgi:hypothetical protein